MVPTHISITFVIYSYSVEFEEFLMLGLQLFTECRKLVSNPLKEININRSDPVV